MTVVTVGGGALDAFRALAAALPPCGDVVLEKVCLYRSPTIAAEADRTGWTVLDGSLRRGVLASVSSHVLLLATGARLRALALALLWDRRSYPFVAATMMDGARIAHAGVGFDHRTLVPVVGTEIGGEDRFFPTALLGAWLVARTLWDDLGGFLPDVDDVGGALDFGLRANDAGWRPLVAARALVDYAPPPLPAPDQFVTHWLASGRLAQLFGLVTGPEDAAASVVLTPEPAAAASH